MESLNPPVARAVRIHPDDNVATLLDDAIAGPVRLLGTGEMLMTAMEPIAAGHKIALHPIAAGQAVVKYGFPIGRALRELTAGEWVHLHNIVSNYDERSSTLDLDTGAPTDTSHAYH